MNHLASRVLVTIVTHNSEGVIGSCLDALAKQTYKNLNVQVIDNASEDETENIVRKFRVAFIRNKTNLGYAKAHNQGIRRSKEPYILTLNPDVILDSNFISHMVSVLDKNPHVGSAAGLLFRVESLSEKSSVIDGAGLTMSASRRQRLRFEAKDVNAVALKQSYIFGPDGSAAFYRRSMLYDIVENFEIFDEAFFMHKEDVDVCWRAQLRGWKSLFVPDARAYHVRTFRAGHRANIDPWMRTIAVRNRYYLMLKNDLVLLFLRDFIWIMLYEIGIFFYLVFKERQSLGAYEQLLKMVPSMLRKRARIQKHRKVTLVYMAQWFPWRAI